MNYRTLGKTALQVSELGYGGSSLERNVRSCGEAIRSLHLALDHGINFIDTETSYWDTTFERILGKALLDIPREQFLLANRVGRFGLQRRSLGLTATEVLRGLDQSLRACR